MAQGRTDAAALPELVRHVRAPVDQQHDAGRVVHREPRQPSEPSLADAGRRREHERSPSVLALGTPRAAVEHQLRPGARRPASRSPYAGFNGNVAQALRQYPAVPEHRLARASRPVRVSTTRSSSFSSAASRGDSSSASATRTRKLNNNGAESAQGNNGDQRRRPGSRHEHRSTGD